MLLLIELGYSRRYVERRMDVWYEYVCNWTANILLTYMVGLAIRAGFYCNKLAVACRRSVGVWCVLKSGDFIGE